MNGTTPQRPSLVHQPTSTKRKRLSDGQADEDMNMGDDSGMANGMDDMHMGGIHGNVVENGGSGWQGRIFENDTRETKVSSGSDGPDCMLTECCSKCGRRTIRQHQ
jgi:hypothetical protein